jgi:hypothetical protein
MRFALAGAVFVVAFARAWSQPAATDASFHLLRAGDSLLRGSLQAYAVPPGGEGAPPLGAIAAQLSTAAPGGFDEILRVPGAILLGLCAALLLSSIAKRAGVLAALFAIVLLLLVPSFTSSFAARPDQALAGYFSLGALCAALESRSLAKQQTLATLSAMASPFALPSLVVLPFFAPAQERRNPRSWLAPAVALALMAGLSFALPPGMRSEILRGITSGWGAPGIGFRSTARALAASPISAIVLAIPLLAVVRKSPVPGVPPSVHLTFVSCFLVTILLAKPDAFSGFLPAIAPSACLLAALLVAAIPDRVAIPGALRRPILFALFLPVLAFVLESDREERSRDAERVRAARDAQVGAHWRERTTSEESIAATSTGALAYFSERPVYSLDRIHRFEVLPAGAAGNHVHDAVPISTNPASAPFANAVVFEKALLASRPQETRLLREPTFLFSFAPYLFRRGQHFEFQDAIWLRRGRPFSVAASSSESISPEYVSNLLHGWDAHARNANEEAARAFAAAAAAEPVGLGIAQEWAGILADLHGHTEIAATRFEAALRDPATARARGHLADRAISAGDLARADSLLKQALAWNVDETELWGTLARLQVVRGEIAQAKESSSRAIRMYPANARLIMNHGSILWRVGEQIEAKQLWTAAVQLDSRILRFLGDFENAPPTAPAPPPIPLFSFAEFAPKRTAEPGHAPRRTAPNLNPRSK